MKVLIQIEPKDLGDTSQEAKVICFKGRQVISDVEPYGHPVDVGFDAPAEVVTELVDIGRPKDVVELEPDAMKAHAARQERRHITLQEEEENVSFDIRRRRFTSLYPILECPGR